MCPVVLGLFAIISEYFQYHASEPPSFLWLNSIPLILHHILFIHLIIDGHMDCFHFLDIIHNAPNIYYICLNTNIVCVFWKYIAVLFIFPLLKDYKLQNNLFKSQLLLSIYFSQKYVTTFGVYNHSLLLIMS